MKFTSVILCGFLILLATGFCKAQGAKQDTLAYKIGYYKVKAKTERVFDVALKLGLDPDIIAKMNDYRSNMQEIHAGQKIKIPVYPKSAVQLKDVQVIYDDKSPSKPKEQKTSPAASTSANTAAEQAAYLELQENRLMLVNATMELNEALLEGLRVSLDSLNVENKNVVDEKNISATLHNMERSRDRALLKPYLIHMQDSLKSEIQKSKKVKESLEYKIQASKSAAPNLDLTADNSAAVENVSQPSAPAPVIKQEPKPVVTAKAADKPEKPSKGRDKKQTDEPPPTPKKEIKPAVTPPAPETAQAKTDKTNPPTPETKTADVSPAKSTTVDSSSSVVANKGATAVRAQPVAQTDKGGAAKKDSKSSKSSEKPVVTADSNPVLASAPDKVAAPKTNVEPATSDSKKTTAADERKRAAIMPPVASPVAAEKHWEPAKALAPIDDNSIASGSASYRIPLPEPIPMMDVNKSDKPLTMADSIKRLQAELFLTRALKAINDRNYLNAEQYLKRAIDLYPQYYTAWFAIADVDLLSGLNAKALDEYKTCEKIDSTSPRLYYKMGNASFNLKIKSDALKYYEKSLQLDPNYIPAIMGHANVLADLKHYQTAIVDYNRILAMNKSYHSAFKGRGIAEYMLKDYTAAVDDISRFLIFEDDPAAYYYRGMARIAIKQVPDGCLDLSNSERLGYVGAEKIYEKKCVSDD